MIFTTINQMCLMFLSVISSCVSLSLFSERPEIISDELKSRKNAHEITNVIIKSFQCRLGISANRKNVGVNYTMNGINKHFIKGVIIFARKPKEYQRSFALSLQNTSH